MHKLYKILFILSIFLNFSSLQAQEAVIASGGVAAGNGGTVAWSVGLIAYTSIDNLYGSVSQGMQQPFEIFTVGIDDYKEITLSMSVYPNPTSEFIWLKMTTGKFETLGYQLFDFSGKLLLDQKISSMETSISMVNFPAATYFLKISSNNQALKTFKIIKNQ